MLSRSLIVRERGKKRYLLRSQECALPKAQMHSRGYFCTADSCVLLLPVVPSLSVDSLSYR